MIPKLIHFVWVQGNLPDKYKPYVKSWVTYNPDYEVRIWNQDEFLKEVAEDTLPIVTTTFMNEYHKQNRMAFKSDLIRVYALKKYGGVYVDTDIQCLRPMADTEFVSDIMFCYAQFDSKILTQITPIVDIYFIVSSQGNPIWDAVINEFADVPTIVSNFVPRIVVVIYKTLIRAGKLSDHMFDVNFITKSEDMVTDKTLGIHECHGTWNKSLLEKFKVGVRDSGWFMDIGIMLLLIIILVVLVVQIIKGRLKKSELSMKKHVSVT